MKSHYLLFLFLLIFLNTFSQKNQTVKNDNFVENLMLTRPQFFAEIIKNSKKHRLQILYTQIDRDPEGNPHFTNYTTA